MYCLYYITREEQPIINAIPLMSHLSQGYIITYFLSLMCCILNNYSPHMHIFNQAFVFIIYRCRKPQALSLKRIKVLHQEASISNQQNPL